MSNYKLSYFKPTEISFNNNELNDVIVFIEQNYKRTKRNIFYSLIPATIGGVVFLVFEIGKMSYNPWYQFYDAIGVPLKYKDYISGLIVLGIIISIILFLMSLNFFLRIQAMWFVIKELKKIRFNSSTQFEMVIHATQSYLRYRKKLAEDLLILKINNLYLRLNKATSIKSFHSSSKYNSTTKHHLTLYITDIKNKTNYIHAYLNSKDVSIGESIGINKLNSNSEHLSLFLFNLKQDEEKISQFYIKHLIQNLN